MASSPGCWKQKTASKVILLAPDLYTKQCSLNVSDKDLAVTGATVQRGGSARSFHFDCVTVRSLARSEPTSIAKAR
jgi:glutaminase